MDDDQNNGGSAPVGGDGDQATAAPKCHCGRGLNNGTCAGCNEADCTCEPVAEETQGEESPAGTPAGDDDQGENQGGTPPTM